MHPASTSNTTLDPEMFMESTPTLVYEFSQDHVALLTPLLEDAAEKADCFASIADNIRELSSKRGVAISRELQWELDLLFSFELIQGSPATKVTLEPVSSSGTLTWPRPMDQASEAAKKLWTALDGVVVHPLLKALMGDVLLSSRLDPKPDIARKIVDGHLSASRIAHIDSIQITDGLLRALTIASGYGLLPEEAAIRLRMFEVCKSGLANAGYAGATVPLAEALALVPRSGSFSSPTKSEIAGLLDSAHALYPGNQFAIDAIGDAARSLSTDEGGRTRASERQVQAYIDLAESSEQGMVRMHHLNSAAQMAKRFGVVAAGKVAVTKMQSIKPEDMNWQVHERSLSLPRFELEKYLRRYRRAKNWQDYLSIWLLSDSPTGNFTTNMNAAKSASSRSTLASLLPVGMFGAHGLPQKMYATPDENELRLLVQIEEGMAQFHGMLLAEALTRMPQRWGTPSTEEVAAYLVTTYRCDAQLAFVLATSLSLFWGSHFTAAGHLIYSKVEAAARGLLLLLDEPLYKVEMGKAIGQFPALDFYLTSLISHGLDVDWVRAIKSVLLSEGSNIRNLTAHGFKNVFAADEVAVLIRIAAMLIVLTPHDADETDKKALRKLFKRPLAKARGPLRRRIRLVWE